MLYNIVIPTNWIKKYHNILLMFYEWQTVLEQAADHADLLWILLSAMQFYISVLCGILHIWAITQFKQVLQRLGKTMQLWTRNINMKLYDYESFKKEHYRAKSKMIQFAQEWDDALKFSVDIDSSLALDKLLCLCTQTKI